MFPGVQTFDLGLSVAFLPQTNDPTCLTKRTSAGNLVALPPLLPDAVLVDVKATQFEDAIFHGRVKVELAVLSQASCERNNTCIELTNSFQRTVASPPAAPPFYDQRSKSA